MSHKFEYIKVVREYFFCKFTQVPDILLILISMDFVLVIQRGIQNSVKGSGEAFCKNS